MTDVDMLALLHHLYEMASRIETIAVKQVRDIGTADDEILWARDIFETASQQKSHLGMSILDMLATPPVAQPVLSVS